MSVKLLPLYQSLVTNTTADTPRLLVQKRSIVCVSTLCTYVCVCEFLHYSLSLAPSRLCCERHSVEAAMYFLVKLNVLQMIKASFINSLPKPFLPVAAQTSTAEGWCVFVSVTVSLPHTLLFTYDPLKIDDLSIYSLVCVSPRLHFVSVTRTAAQSVKLLSLNFSNWSISERLRQTEINWS